MSVTNTSAGYRICRLFSCINANLKTKTIPEELIRECGICFTKKYIPKTRHYDCSHNEFCNSCIIEWKKRGNTCPMCRAEPKPMTRYRVF